MIDVEAPIKVHHHSEWSFYLAGAVLTLAWKWWRWCWEGKKQGKSIKSSTIEWFSIELFEDKISWFTTIGIVWVFGASYIDRMTFLWSDWLNFLPVEESIAFLFGSMMEWIAPALVKKVMSKLPI